MLEVFFMLVGLLAMAAIVYTYIFVFQNWKKAPNAWAKAALVGSAVYFVIVFLNLMTGGY